MSLDYTYIIATIAKKHNILIDKEDPIIAALVLNEVCYDEYVKVFNSNVEKLKSELEQISATYTESSKQIATVLINQVAKQSGRQVELHISNSIKPLLETTEDNIKKALKENKETLQETNKNKRVCGYFLAASCIVSVATIALNFYL